MHTTITTTITNSSKLDPTNRLCEWAVSVDDCLAARACFKAVAHGSEAITKAQWDAAVAHDCGKGESALKSLLEDSWVVFDKNRDGVINVCAFLQFILAANTCVRAHEYLHGCT